MLGIAAVVTGGGLTSYGLLSSDSPAPVPTGAAGWNPDQGNLVVVADPAQAVDDTLTAAPGCPADPAQLPPMTLMIPSLGICAKMEAHGQGQARFHGRTVAGLEIPDDPAQITLNADGADCTAPQGTVLLAGHVAWRKTPGALARLADLPPSALAYVRCANGPTTIWRQTQWELSAKESLDQSVYQADGPRRLVLVTCAGPLENDGTYRSNLTQSFKPEGQKS